MIGNPTQRWLQAATRPGLHRLVVLSLVFCLPDPFLARSESDDFFEKSIRPLFVDQCVRCHGSEGSGAGFRLDSRIGFDGNSEESKNGFLSYMMNSQSGAESESNPHRLDRASLEALKRWISEGAPWPAVVSMEDQRGEDGELWALQPIQRFRPPEVDDPSWNVHPIDRFIYTKLKHRGLVPSDKATPRTLIRRLYLDLTGLPPTFDELEKLEETWSETSFQNLMNDLLARPEYGERWGRHWLDVARYADAKGYVDSGEVKYPFAYTYRDYVIRAFNRDLPFNGFIKEQLAADRLSGKQDLESLAALGFLTVGHRFNFFPDEIIDDRIDVITRGFLGLTASCARCHDHKFDPISTANYYSLFGMLRNSVEPSPDQFPELPSWPEIHPDNERTVKIKEAAEAYHQLRKELYVKMSHEMRRWAGDYLKYIVQSDPGHRTQPQPDQRTERGLIRVQSAYSAGGVVRWERFLQSIDDHHPLFGLWNRFWSMDEKDIPDQADRILDSCLKQPSINPIFVQAAVAKEGGIRSMADLADVYAEVMESVCAEWEGLKASNPVVRGLPEEHREAVRAWLYGPESPGTFSLDESEDLYTLDESTKVRTHFANIERMFLEEWDSVSPRPMVLRDRSEAERAEQVVYKRGNRLNPGSVVPREVPAIFNAGENRAVTRGSGRLELAEAIASDSNPLTARVLVNRIWAWHFGTGLVDSPSDFGSRSTPPSHPELLDFLAHWFMDHGWSVKEMHRLILTSRTWQQRSENREMPYTVDPENRQLWKMNRLRLDFETMRDSILSVSGLLDRRLGGLPVLKNPDDPGHSRRTLYTFIDRENLADVFRVFDFPTPDISADQRNATNVPQQALFLINSPFVIHAAEVIADGILGDSDGVEASHLNRLYQTILLRHPSQDEMMRCRSYLQPKAQSEATKTQETESFAELVQALLVSNEFQFVD